MSKKSKRQHSHWSIADNIPEPTASVWTDHQWDFGQKTGLCLSVYNWKLCTRCPTAFWEPDLAKEWLIKRFWRYIGGA